MHFFTRIFFTQNFCLFYNNFFREQKQFFLHQNVYFFTPRIYFLHQEFIFLHQEFIFLHQKIIFLHQILNFRTFFILNVTESIFPDSENVLVGQNTYVCLGLNENIRPICPFLFVKYGKTSNMYSLIPGRMCKIL